MPRSLDRSSPGPARRSLAPWADPAATPLIRFEAVSKRFGGTVAVDGVSLDIFEGEFFCLLGPSGCGKTTLMRMLAGFEEPSAGQVRLGGRDLAGVPPHRRPVNMMFQSYALFPHMTVAGNVAFGLKQDRLPKAEVEARVGEMLRLVQLEGFGSRRPDQLSGGQRQRVALARALAKRPKVLLLDEPLGALDKKLRQETQFELKDIQARLGTTFLVVTHDQEEAMSMADRIGVMDRGRVVQVAPPPDVYEHPATRFVAEFIGDINLFEGRVAGADGVGMRVETSAGPLLVADERRDAGAGQAVAVAVRPEKMRLARDPGLTLANRLRGEVWDVGYLGDWSMVRVKLASGALVRVAEPNAARTAARDLERGAAVTVSFAPEAAILLGE